MFLNRATDSRWSLAGRLAVWYGASAFLLLLAAEGFLFWRMQSTLNHEDDKDMVDRASMVQRLINDRPGDTAMLQDVVQWKSPETLFEPIFVRVLDGASNVVAETIGMADQLPVSMFREPLLDGAALRNASGRPFRVLAPRRIHGYRIQVAIDYSDEEKLLAHSWRQLVLVSITGLVICAATGYGLARRGIRPVAQMAATIQTIHSSTLHERVETGRLPMELAALGGTFNAMLDRLGDSFGRLSQFSADIAHELRTPINNLRGEVEVALSKPRTEAEYRDVLSSGLEECERLSRLIDRLLFLARAENPKMEIQRERLDVTRELQTLCEFYDAGASEAGVRLALEAPAGMTADLDRTLFQHAVGNLIDNALTYTARGGSVSLTARQQNGLLEVEVADTGCGIAAEEIPKLFDRFYRVDSARTRESGGYGLGLTIVKSVVALHGGDVRVTSRVGAGTTVTLQFPQST